MKNISRKFSLAISYVMIMSLFLFMIIGGNRAVTVITENLPITNRTCIIIDAGHGGEDGGTTSCTGVLESKINLEIALRLEDLLHLLGYDTYMIRTTDRSVYTSGETIAAKKVSDLKERVRIANSTQNAILVSIHQNHFTDSKYRGAQVFYAATDGSKELAMVLQECIKSMDTSNQRQIKKADGVYLMKHIDCPGVLIECGFLSNHEEESLLRNPEYQKMLSAVIAKACGNFIVETKKVFS